MKLASKINIISKLMEDSYLVLRIKERLNEILKDLNKFNRSKHLLNKEE